MGNIVTGCKNHKRRKSCRDNGETKNTQREIHLATDARVNTRRGTSGETKQNKMP